MIRFDDRGVSTVLGYVLTVGISSLLVIGLLVGTGGFVDGQRQETVRDELEVLGQQLAGDLAAADRMVTVSGEEVSIDRDFPSEVTGITYTLRVNPSASSTDLVLSTENPDVSVTVTIRNRTDVDDAVLTGGDVVVVYDQGDDELEVQNA